MNWHQHTEVHLLANAEGRVLARINFSEVNRVWTLRLKDAPGGEYLTLENAKSAAIASPLLKPKPPKPQTQVLETDPWNT